MEHARRPGAAGPTHRTPRPDARPTRLAIGAGGLAAFSALLALIVAPTKPLVATPPPTSTAGGAPGTPGTVAVQREVRYIQLAPGQSAPPGATVIDAKAPKPITIVTRVPAPAQRTVVVRTTQSGVVLP